MGGQQSSPTPAKRLSRVLESSAQHSFFIGALAAAYEAAAMQGGRI